MLARVLNTCLVLALSSACVGGGRGQPDPQPTVQVPDGSLRLLVARSSGPLESYAVGRDRRAQLVGTIRPPFVGARATSIAAALGPRGDVCVVWSRQSAADQVACYEHGSGAAQVVARPEDAGLVALTGDAGTIAWTELHRKPRWGTAVTELVVGPRRGEKRVRLPSTDQPCERECYEFKSPSRLAFASPDELVISLDCESDDSCDLRRLRLPGAKTWSDSSALKVDRRAPRGYRYYDRVGSAGGGRALVVMRPYGYGDSDLSEQVVHVDLATGRVVDRVATAQGSRIFWTVNEGPAGVAYTTVAGWPDEDGRLPEPRFSVRFPGESRGAPVSGLPSDTIEVVTSG